MRVSIEQGHALVLRGLLLAGAMLLIPGVASAELSREQAATMAARSQEGARVLAVERAEAGGFAVWRVKLVTPNGDVKVVVLSAGAEGSGKMSPERVERWPERDR